MVRDHDSFESLLTKLGKPGWGDPSHTCEMETIAMQEYSGRSRRRAKIRGLVVAAMVIGAPLVGTIGYATGGKERIFRWFSMEVVNSSGEMVNSVDLDEAEDGSRSVRVGGKIVDEIPSGFQLTQDISAPGANDVIIRSSRHPDGISLKQLLRDAGVLEPTVEVDASTDDQYTTIGDASVQGFLRLGPLDGVSLMDLVSSSVADATRFAADLGETESDWEWTDALGRSRELYILRVAESEREEQLMVRVAYTYYDPAGLAQIILTDQLTSCGAASEESFVEMLWQDGEAVLVFGDSDGETCDVVLDSADHLGDPTE